jgi:hypothetical protein
MVSLAAGWRPQARRTVLEFLNNYGGWEPSRNIGLSYRPARLHTHSLAELVLGLLKSLKIRAQVGGKMDFWNGIEFPCPTNMLIFEAGTDFSCPADSCHIVYVLEMH